MTFGHFWDPERIALPTVMNHGVTITVCSGEALQRHAGCIIYDHRGRGNSKDANVGSPTIETLAADLNELIEGLSLKSIFPPSFVKSGESFF